MNPREKKASEFMANTAAASAGQNIAARLAPIYEKKVYFPLARINAVPTGYTEKGKPVYPKTKPQARLRMAKIICCMRFSFFVAVDFFRIAFAFIGYPEKRAYGSFFALRTSFLAVFREEDNKEFMCVFMACIFSLPFALVINGKFVVVWINYNPVSLKKRSKEGKHDFF